MALPATSTEAGADCTIAATITAARRATGRRSFSKAFIAGQTSRPPGDTPSPEEGNLVGGRYHPLGRLCLAMR